MSNSPPEIVEEMLKKPQTSPDLIIDGIHFGRGDSYKDASTLITYTTTEVKCWRIVNETLDQIKDKSINNFYDCETYIVQWNSIASDKKKNNIFFYWKGEQASKGYSPLPEEIEKDNPPVERITQWSEPPAFLRLFSGKFVVHKGKHDSLNSQQQRLYILRGEMDDEVHLFEVPMTRESLRSRTSFVLVDFKKKLTTLWHGCRSNSQSKKLVKQVAGKVFNFKIKEIDENSQNADFLKHFRNDESEHFVDSVKKIIDYTPRLFYLNKITDSFLATEIECSHKSEFNTPFPFLQSHLYTAIQPATFLLDDDDEIWLWHGWNRENEDDSFKSECFATIIAYAKQKSKAGEKLIKVQKVIAGFEPTKFTNLFPTWNKREDVAEIQKKDGMIPNSNSLIEVDPVNNK